jgi:hypothetical protein
MCCELQFRTPGLLMPKCEPFARAPRRHASTYGFRRYWLALIDALAADAHNEAQPAAVRSSESENSLVAALSALSVEQLMVGMEEPDLLPQPLFDAMLHPADFAFLRVLQELMAGTVGHHTHDMLLWCSEHSGDCAFILSTLLTVGDARMNLERDVIRASTLLQKCSSNHEHFLCRLAWSSRFRVARDADERSASETNSDDVDVLLQVLARHAFLSRNMLMLFSVVGWI